jgi:hypothetical protein
MCENQLKEFKKKNLNGGWSKTLLLKSSSQGIVYPR